jgi:hypothetical protein
MFSNYFIPHFLVNPISSILGEQIEEVFSSKNIPEGWPGDLSRGLGPQGLCQYHKVRKLWVKGQKSTEIQEDREIPQTGSRK